MSKRIIGLITAGTLFFSISSVVWAEETVAVEVNADSVSEETELTIFENERALMAERLDGDGGYTVDDEEEIVLGAYTKTDQLKHQKVCFNKLVKYLRSLPDEDWTTNKTLYSRLESPTGSVSFCYITLSEREDEYNVYDNTIIFDWQMYPGGNVVLSSGFIAEDGIIREGSFCSSIRGTEYEIYDFEGSARVLSEDIKLEKDTFNYEFDIEKGNPYSPVSYQELKYEANQNLYTGLLGMEALLNESVGFGLKDLGFISWGNPFRIIHENVVEPGVKATDYKDGTTDKIYCKICGAVQQDHKVIRATGIKDMYRLYNPNSGEHFYTASAGEKNNLVRLGWSYEGIGWIAPKTSKTPVYRLYNPNSGDHHYTTNKGEKDMLVRVGWNYEQIGWYSDDAKGVALYRQYNPNCKGAGSHNYTTNKKENDWLVSIGWNYEGIGWYGVK